MRKLNLFFIFFTVILLLPIVAKALPTVPPGYTIEIYASGLTNPGNMALDSYGNLFVVDGNWAVYKIAPNGQVSLFAEGILDADGLTIDQSDNLFISGNGKITKVNSSGLATTIASGFSNLNGIAIDNLNNLFVADLHAGKILKVSQNGSVNIFSSAVQSPSDVVFNSQGELFVSDVGLISILRVSPNGDLTTYYPEVGVPRFHPSGDLYLANPTLASVGEIWRITPAGNETTFATGFDHPIGLLFDSSNNLYVADKFAGIIYKISPTIDVAIDIKPGSDPNCFNLNGHGVIPVAINGSDSFSVYDIDVEFLSFGGLSVRVRGNRGPLCSVEDWNEDGYSDLVCHFEDDPDNWTIGGDSATLTGILFDGTPFQGTDSICIVP